MNLTDIENKINSFGYFLPKVKKLSPSYYQLNDGTIIEAIVKIETILEGKDNPDGFILRSSNEVRSYVPKEIRDPSKHENVQLNDLSIGIIEQDVESKELLTPFSEYELSNGTLSVRTIVNQINKTKYFSAEGEPIYSVSLTPIIKYKKNE